jgi:hypothetical protein
LKERLFGLTGSEGNHGEDVKEYYFYLDSTPTHSYMKFLYKYRILFATHACKSVEGRAGGSATGVCGALLWSKQFYHYDVNEWLNGDPAGPAPPSSRLHGRNREWGHLYNADVISMPDKWEYPWYAAWDLAFHTMPLAQIDPDFAKE